jgi:hypothetical protein
MPGIQLFRFPGDDFAFVLLEDADTARVRLADSGEPILLSDPPGWRMGTIPVTGDADVQLVVEMDSTSWRATASRPPPKPKPPPVRRRRRLRLVES